MAKNHAATTGPRGPRLPGAGGGEPGGTGPYSGWNRYATCFTGSTLMVFAPRIVATVATTVYLSGASSCTTVTLLSRPAGMKMSFSTGSHPRAPTPSPFAIVATTFPVPGSTTTAVLLHPEKIRFVVRS